MKNRRDKAFLMVALSFVALFCSCGQQPKREAPDPAPIETIADDGVTVKVYDYKSFEGFLKKDSDSIYVINFWATWCAPCVAELPNFERLGAQYKDKKVSVLLVSLDFRKQVRKSLIPFIREKQLQSKVVLLSDPDSNNWIPKIDPDWSGALPATLIVARGQSKFYERSFTYDELENELKTFNP